jgi:hypothetical protein
MKNTLDHRNLYSKSILKTPVPFTDRNNLKSRSWRKFPQPGKGVYEKQVANITLNGRKQKALPSETRHEFPLSPLLFNIVLKILAKVIRWEKNRSISHPNYRKRNKIIPIHDKISLYTENPKDAIHTYTQTHTYIHRKRLGEVINLAKLQDKRATHKNHCISIY